MVPLMLIATTDIPRRPEPSAPSFPSLQILLCRSDGAFQSIHKLLWQFSFMAVSHRFTLLLKSPDSTPSTTKFSDKSSKLKVPFTTGSCSPQMRNVQRLFFQLAYAHAPRLLIPSQRIPVQRLRCLGHILRHFDSLEHKISFNISHSLRTISSPFRIGRSRVHWPEIAMSEAYRRYLQLHNGQSAPPSIRDFHNCNSSKLLWPLLD